MQTFVSIWHFYAPPANGQFSMAEAEFLKQHVHTCEPVSSTSLRSTARHETAA